MKILAENLSSGFTEEELRLTFEQFGKVESATIMKDKESGQSKGFGIVEMASSDEAKFAINGLNGKEFQGKAINVSEAGSRAERRGNRSGYSGGRSGYRSGKSRYIGGGGGFGGRKGGQSRGR